MAGGGCKLLTNFSHRQDWGQSRNPHHYNRLSATPNIRLGARVCVTRQGSVALPEGTARLPGPIRAKQSVRAAQVACPVTASIET
jgi:hypothetical protein